MKKIFIVLASCSLLLGCATFQADVAKVKASVQSVLSPDNLDSLEATYGVAIASAVTYRGLCQRKVINKSCWVVIAKMQPYELKAYNSVLALRTFVRNNPTLDASSLVQLARTAILTLKSFETTNGVQ